MSTTIVNHPATNEGMPLWRAQDIGQKYRAAERSDSYGALSPMASPAQQLIKQSGLASFAATSPVRVFDNACGTGIVTNFLQKNPQFREREGGFEILCGDLSEGMLEAARTRGKEDGWEGVSYQVVDAQNTNLPSESFTHILINFGVMLFPDHKAALSECWRLLRPGGTLGFTTWKELEWPSLVDLGLSRLGPPCPQMSTCLDAFSQALLWSNAEFITSKLTNNPDQPFQDIKVDFLDFDTTFTVDEVEKGGSGVMFKQIVTSTWSDEDKAAWGDKLLPAVGEALREKHGEREFPVNWKAVITTAIKPL